MILEDSYISFLNLDHREDRRERMYRQLDALGIAAVRTPGGQKYEGDPENVRRMLEGSTPATVQCYVGQLSIMREALARGKHAFVMEDDLVFCNDFRRRLHIIEDYLSEHEWDVFWFGATFHVNPPVWHKDTLGKDVELTGHPRIVQTYGCWSTYCYLINRESLAWIIAEHEQHLPESVGIDTTFIEMQPGLAAYAFVPGCVKQYDGWSDITHSNSRFSGFERLGPYWWQQRMEDFDPESFEWAEAK